MLGVGDFPEFALEEVKLKFKGKNDLQCFLGEEFAGGGGGFPRAAAASENSGAGKIQLVRTTFAIFSSFFLSDFPSFLFTF